MLLFVSLPFPYMMIQSSPYQVRINLYTTAPLTNQFVCSSNTGVGIGSPTINSASRLTEDPSKARVEWTPTANVVDVRIYSGNTFNVVRTRAHCIIHCIDALLYNS